MTIAAKVIADSVGPSGKRLTTLQLRYPKFIHGEFRTHGVFKENTVYMQGAKDFMRMQPNWMKMPEYQREALDMFAHKIGRILHGDPSYLDHWEDIAGYAQRVVKTIKGDLTP